MENLSKENQKNKNMRNWFKVSVFILVLGWIPFAFLCAWGHNQELNVRLIISLIGFVLCFMGMGGLLAFLNDKFWWLTHKELQTEKNAYEVLVGEAIKVRDTFTRKIVLADKDNDFIVRSLNAYWNDAHTQLQRNDLGDIERKNYEYQLKESKRIMDEKDRV